MTPQGEATKMTRFILVALAATVSVCVVSGTGCNATGVGDPCVPEAEYSPAFLDFKFTEVNVESKSYQCQTRLCLANHFQGRVTCPYGQDPSGTTAFGSMKGSPCLTPIGQKVDGIDPATGTYDNPCSGTATDCNAAVLPNCKDRTGTNAVYCSCRCMDVDGNRPSDQVFCDCPTGFTCTQLVTSINQGNEGLTGGYCVKNGTQYTMATSCVPCVDSSCGKAQGLGP
jgi:hypothetical protein